MNNEQYIFILMELIFVNCKKANNYFMFVHSAFANVKTEIVNLKIY